MSQNLINILIWKNQKKGILFFASIGMFIGLFILFISIQLYFDLIIASNKDKDIFQKDYIVINKKVSLLNTVKFLDTGFSNKEIDSLKNQSFVDKIGLITPNKFKVGAYTDGNDELPAFYAEMFFESVPNEFMDINSTEWKWDTSSAFIPIVIPRDYLKLYNFGFAQSQNLPQISEEIASKAMADFIIEGRGQKLRMKGKIVGFTDRINSILVPEDFMNWANKKLGRSQQDKQPSRIILVCKNPSDPSFVKYLRDHNYEANLQQTKSSRLNTLLQIILSIVSLIGVLIILLAFMVFVISFKLMISRALNTIEKLLLIGYHYTVPARIYIFIYSIILIFVFSFSMLNLVFAKSLLLETFSEIGFPIASGLSLWMLTICISILIILLLANSLSILFQFKKMAHK